MASPDNSKYTTEPDAGARFRRNLVRVMAVQVISLVVLWLLQQHYSV
jgi:hypothetical protein